MFVWIPRPRCEIKLSMKFEFLGISSGFIGAYNSHYKELQFQLNSHNTRSGKTKREQLN
jgi:hypothetical protein